MEKIYTNLFVGSDLDYAKLKAEKGWSFARMCKYKDGGHQQVLEYTSLSAPKNKNYLSVRPKDSHLAVNIIDVNDPNFVPIECILIAIKFVKERLDAGDKVLIACNAGKSRSTSTGLAFLRAIGDFPYSFSVSEKIYHTICPTYDPNLGIRQVLRSNWSNLDNLLNKQES